MSALTGKVAIITGAGSGIGRASALRFADEGAKLVLGDKTEAVHETAQMVKDAGGSATALQIDAGVEADVQKIVKTAIETYGDLHVAFANAGISGGMAGIFDLTPEEWSEILRVNLIGPWLMVKHAGQAMMDGGKGGSIILTASVAGIRSGAGGPAYAASKAGVINLAMVSAQQMSETGVRVNAICPGIVITDIIKNNGPATAKAMGMELDEMIAMFAADSAIKRPNTVEEVAAVAVLLASEAGAGITGQQISVDGGTAQY